MKGLKYLGVVGTFIVMMLIGFSFLAPQICEKEVAKTFIDEQVSSKFTGSFDQVLSYIYSDDEVKQITDRMDAYLTDNQVMTEFALNYIQAIKKTIGSTSGESLRSKLSNQEISVLDHLNTQKSESQIAQFSSEMVQALKGNQDNDENNLLSQIFSDKTVTALIQNVNKEISNVCNTQLQKMPQVLITLLKCYIALTSTTARVVLIVLAVLFLLLAVLGSNPKTSCLLPMGVVYVVTGLGWILMSQLIKAIIAKYTQRMSVFEYTPIHLQVGPWIIYGVVLMIVGIAGIILNSVCNKKKSFI